MEVAERWRERFWFLPALMCLGAAVAAEVLVSVDEAVGTLPLPSWAQLVVYRVGESGSRDILTAIATSALAVAGTTFSITVAVLALTSSTYGPRLVRNFMTDRANQAVLGVFVATFLYSLLVLRSVRALGDPGDPEAEVFIPHLAVNGAGVLAVANVAVLVFFIHHIADSVQVSTIARRVRTDLQATVDRLYPEELGRSPADVRAADSRSAEHDLPDAADVEGAGVVGGTPGYVRFVHDEALMSAARDHDVVLSLQVHPGRYVLEDSTICVVHPPDRTSDALAAKVRSAVVIGDSRSPYQDVGFAVQQLTELAVRALSPGTNDPYTAINAVDDLSAGLSSLAGRRMPSPYRFDDDGALRVHAPYPDVAALTGTALDTLRWYAAGAPSVMHAALTLVERVGDRTADERLRAALRQHVDLLVEAFRSADHQSHDLDAFLRRADDVASSLSGRRGS